MEGADSPLEVLSLAATMVQGSCLPPSYEEARKELPSARWRRDRRGRSTLPDYATSNAASNARDCQVLDGPLDMSTRSRASPRAAERAERAERADRADRNVAARINAKLASLMHSQPPPSRGSPPSYSEAISKPGYRLSVPLPRPSVITCAPPSPTLLKDSDSTEKITKNNCSVDSISGDGMCDPVIDEHFRRSLGKDYLTLFAKKSTSSKSTNCVEEVEEEDHGGLSITGLSVDDHFAKALGDTWIKLKAESAKTSLPTVPAKSTTKEVANATIPRPRRGVVTI